MSFQPYLDMSGRSAIVGYDNEYEDSITVFFKNGQQYTYTYDSAGEDNVQAMKELAKSGQGLNSYIYNNCRFDYE